MKRTAIALTLIIALLFSAVAGTLVVNLGKANPFIPIPAPVHPQITILSPENHAVHASNTLTIGFNVSISFEKGWVYISEVTYTASWQQDETVVYEHPRNDTYYPSSFSYNLNLTEIPEGKQSVIISAKGGGGYNDEHNYAHLFDDAHNSTSVSFTIASISILSPQNKTYTISDLPLNLTVNALFSKISYVLDGLENVTVDGNTTLTNLANGDHNLTIYATDEAGNTETSETLYFTVEVPENFPTTLVITASGASLTVVGVVLLVYFKKRKRGVVQE